MGAGCSGAKAQGCQSLLRLPTPSLSPPKPWDPCLTGRPLNQRGPSRPRQGLSPWGSGGGVWEPHRQGPGMSTRVTGEQQAGSHGLAAPVPASMLREGAGLAAGLTPRSPAPRRQSSATLTWDRATWPLLLPAPSCQTHLYGARRHVCQGAHRPEALKRPGPCGAGGWKGLTLSSQAQSLHRKCQAQSLHRKWRQPSPLARSLELDPFKSCSQALLPGGVGPRHGVAEGTALGPMAPRGCVLGAGGHCKLLCGG